MRQHPLEHPDFNANRRHEVWYMAHPIAPDDRFTFEQNMAHVVHMMRLFYDAGLFVIAPYHTICLALDEDSLEHRKMGLECDCNVVRCLGRVVMVGHKVSSGMAEERKTCKANHGDVLDFTGWTDAHVTEWVTEYTQKRGSQYRDRPSEIRT